MLELNKLYNMEKQNTYNVYKHILPNGKVYIGITKNIKSRFLKDESLKTKTALGEGDIPLIASFAIIVGLEEVVFLVFLSALLAIVLYIYRVKKFKDGEIPFIPPLAVAFLLEYF